MAENSKGRPPFRADHIGSLLRPAALRQAFKDRAAHRIDDSQFTQIQDRCIRDAVKLQEEAGLQVVTDGEFRRGSYWARFVERLDGLSIKSAVFKFRDDSGHELDFTAPYATGKLKRVRPLALDEFVFLREASQATPKITLPSPSTMHFYRCTDFADRSVYPDADAFFADLGRAYREEIAELAKADCRYVQFDEVAIALLCDPAIRQKVEAIGEKPDRLVDLYIESLNTAMADAPAGMIFGVHMCRGNFKGHYLGAGGYESVAERFFAPERGSITSFLNTTRSAPATSNRCASSRIRASCWASSAAKPRFWSRRRFSSDGWPRQRDISISTGWRSARNAGLPRLLPVIRSPRPMSGLN